MEESRDKPEAVLKTKKKKKRRKNGTGTISGRKIRVIKVRTIHKEVMIDDTINFLLDDSTKLIADVHYMLVPLKEDPQLFPESYELTFIGELSFLNNFIKVAKGMEPFWFIHERNGERKYSPAYVFIEIHLLEETKYTMSYDNNRDSILLKTIKRVLDDIRKNYKVFLRKVKKGLAIKKVKKVKN